MFIVLKKRTLIISMCCCALLISSFVYLGVFNQSVSVSSNDNTNWGLGFSKDGQQPTGNASVDFLKSYNSYFVGSPDQKTLYITFDAGYENGYTPKILDSLKKHNVKATFFVVGNYVKTAPELVNRMLEEGHIVGNHTFTHPDMSKISDMESFKKEMLSLEDAFKEATGKDIEKFYRPPQGKYSENNLKLANELGYKTIFWSLAYVDWYVDKQPTKEQAFEKLLPRTHPGAIVLLHSTSKTNSEILDELLSKWEDQGYSFGTLSDLCK